MHHRRTTSVLTTLLGTIALAASPALAGACPTDLNGDEATGFNDLTAMLSSWGPCAGCPADIDGDQNVGFADLTALLNAWGPCPIDVFEYPAYENALAVEVGQQYLNAPTEIMLPQETYDRVNRDLALMEAARPEITGAPHQGPWVAFNLGVGVDQTLPQDELDATIAFYQGELVDSFFGGDIRVYDFPQGANPDALIPIFEAIPAVEYAEENGFSGPGDLTPRWQPTDVGGGALLWTVVVGWDTHPHLGEFCIGDFSPCECFSTYEFLITLDGTVTPLGLTSEPSPFGAGGDCTGYPPVP